MTEHEMILAYVFGLNVTRTIAAIVLGLMLLGYITPWKKN